MTGGETPGDRRAPDPRPDRPREGRSRPGLELVRARDVAEMNRIAAAHVAGRVAEHPDLLLALATGKTPQGVYDELVRMSHRGEVDFSRATVCNLDEYHGLAPDHPRSFARYLRERFLDRLPRPPLRVHLFDGARPAGAELERRRRLVREHGGYDLLVLGIGRNGHLGFNEPGTPFDRGHHLARLTEATRSAAGPGWVPPYGLTLGLADIARARWNLLLASGTAKAAILRLALRGPVTPDVPASLLQTHPDTTVVADAEAASELDR